MYSSWACAKVVSHKNWQISHLWICFFWRQRLSSFRGLYVTEAPEEKRNAWTIKFSMRARKIAFWGHACERAWISKRFLDQRQKLPSVRNIFVVPFCLEHYSEMGKVEPIMSPPFWKTRVCWVGVPQGFLTVCDIKAVFCSQKIYIYI